MADIRRVDKRRADGRELADGPIVGAPTARIAEAPRMHRDQRFQPCPQLVGQDLLTHEVIMERPVSQAKLTHQLILN